MEDIRRIIDNIYELEGLMRELEYRGEDAPDELYDAAGRKADMIAREVSSLREQGEAVMPAPEPVEVVVPDAVVMPDPEPRFEEADEYVPESVPEPETVSEPEPESEPTQEPDYDDYDSDVTTETEPVTIAPTPHRESIFDAPDMRHDPIPTSEPEETVAEEERGGYHAPAVNLRSMFTINDLFRFRRELFGNSDADMTDVLNMVMAMHSYEEAEEYFYGYLCWPSDNEQVVDFMNVISQYFGNVR